MLLRAIHGASIVVCLCESKDPSHPDQSIYKRKLFISRITASQHVARVGWLIGEDARYGDGSRNSERLAASFHSDVVTVPTSSTTDPGMSLVIHPTRGVINKKRIQI